MMYIDLMSQAHGLCRDLLAEADHRWSQYSERRKREWHHHYRVLITLLSGWTGHSPFGAPTIAEEQRVEALLGDALEWMKEARL